MQHKVLICEDLPSLREHARKVSQSIFLEQKLEALFDEAVDGEQAIAKSRSFNPSLILMDISMPGTNGIKAARAIWQDKPTLKILFWSQYKHEAYIRELGKIVPDEAIHGYLLKSEDDEKLKEAIESIYFNELPYIGAQIQAVRTRLKDTAITDAEYETLMDIFAGLTDKAIAKKEHISYRGAQNRLSNLLNKLLKGEDSFIRETAGIEIFNPRTRLVFEAIRRGLIDFDSINEEKTKLDAWLYSEFGFEPGT
jgi:DNA-binding NarL/FixJ family response regulator